jgi:aminopeptidase
MSRLHPHPRSYIQVIHQNRKVVDMVLTDIQLDRYADVLLWGLKTARKGRFRKGDVVLLQYETAAIKLAEVLYAKLIDMGMNPVQRPVWTCTMEQTFYERSKGRQLFFVPPGEKEMMAHLNGRIFLRAPDSITHLRDIDPSKIGKFLVARKPLRDILDRREEQGVYSWTLCTAPTPELARQARSSLKRYSDQIIRACYLDEENPVERWQWIYKVVGEIKKWLNGLPVKAFVVESETIDLRITPGEKRRWIGISGHNIPSFELFLSPDWRGTEGTYFANLPSFRSGNYVEDIRITFEKGVARTLTAKSGEAFAKKQIAMDRGAKALGEFSLTDRRFSRIDRFMADTLFDENHGGRFGNCHIAVGSSYSDTYSGNPKELTKDLRRRLGFNDSALHWDLVNTEKKAVTAVLKTGERQIIYDGGEFRY